MRSKNGSEVPDQGCQLGTFNDKSDQFGGGPNKGVTIGGGPIRGGPNGQRKVPRGQTFSSLEKRPQNPKTKGSGWIPPLRAKRIYSRVLTKHEESEILGYPRIYFTGQSATKVPGTDSKAPNKGFDDEEGCYRFVTHDHIAYR